MQLSRSSFNGPLAVFIFWISTFLTTSRSFSRRLIMLRSSWTSETLCKEILLRPHPQCLVASKKTIQANIIDNIHIMIRAWSQVLSLWMPRIVCELDQTWQSGPVSKFSIPPSKTNSRWMDRQSPWLFRLPLREWNRSIQAPFGRARSNASQIYRAFQYDCAEVDRYINVINTWENQHSLSLVLSCFQRGSTSIQSLEVCTCGCSQVCGSWALWCGCAKFVLG